MTSFDETPTSVADLQELCRESRVPLQWLGHIPNRVFQTTISGSIGTSEVMHLRSQRLRYPQHNFYIFNEAQVEAYMLHHWSHRKIFAVFHSTSSYAVRADIWRYCVLYHYGGIYADIDSDIGFDPSSIDLQARELISFNGGVLAEVPGINDSPHAGVFASREYAHGGLMHPRNLCLQQALVFAPSHPLLYRVIEVIEQMFDFFRDRVLDEPASAVTLFTGSVAYTRAVWESLDAGVSLLQCDVYYSRTCQFGRPSGIVASSSGPAAFAVSHTGQDKCLARTTIPCWSELDGCKDMRFGVRTTCSPGAGQSMEIAGRRVLFFPIDSSSKVDFTSRTDALCLAISRLKPNEVTSFVLPTEAPAAELLAEANRIEHLLEVFGFVAAYTSSRVPIELIGFSDLSLEGASVRRFVRRVLLEVSQSPNAPPAREDVSRVPKRPGTLSAHEIRALVGTDGPLILEIGAHDGSTTAELLQAMPHARIVCFEPDPRAIRRHRAKLGADPRVTLIPCAVGRTAGAARFWQSGGFEHLHPDGWDHSGSIKPPKEHLNVWPGIRFDKQIEIILTTLDNWHRAAGKPSIDFIWADVQGAEEDLILGSRVALASTRFLYTEYSNNELYEGEIGLQRIYELLPDFKLLALFDGDVLLGRAHVPLRAPRSGLTHAG